MSVLGRRWRPATGWVLVGVVFVIISSLAVAWANGLVFDPTTNTFQPSVIVSVEADIKEARIYLNDKLVADSAPVSFRGLKAGRYQIRIEKTDYQTWQQSWQLSYGQVGQVGQDVRLIAKAPKIESTLGQLGPSVPFDLGLELTKAGELLDQGKLVTSFALSPNQAHRFHNGYVYQLATEIRLAWPEAGFDSKVFDLGLADLAPLTVDEGAWQIRFQAVDRIVTIHLLFPNELPVRTTD